MLLSIVRILRWTFLVGGISFSLGFFGPMLLNPGANQGPLLGILITGPLGVLVGFGIGVAREIIRWTRVRAPGDGSDVPAW